MADEMTEAELDAIEKRANAATEGPWEQAESRNGYDIDIHGDRCKTPGEPDSICWFATVKGNATSLNITAANADFITAARTDVPRLCAEVRRLREELYLNYEASWKETR